MREHLLSRIDDFILRHIPDVFPGASIAVFKRGELIYEKAYGYSEITPYKREVSIDTLFDLASLTKPLVTSLVVARLIEEGLIYLRQRVSEIVPEYSRTNAGYSEAKDKTEIWMLLTHTACLPAWAPLYMMRGKSREELLEEAIRSFVNCEPGTRALYSDIGYIVLTAVVERVAGERLDRLFEKMVARPLGLGRTVFNPLEQGYPVEEIASTEYIDEIGQPLRGVVHDENARALGGVSGHAGLFSTAREVGVIANEVLQSFLGKSEEIIKRPTIRTFLRKWACGDRCYSLGWMVYTGSSGQFCGDLMSPERAFGHTGFTGTSVCIDTEHETVVVLLTNRVHPTRNNNRILGFRPRFHNLVMSLIE